MNTINYNDVIFGEPEITFRLSSENQVSLWIGTFDSLMKYAVPKSDGRWDSMSLHYHMHDGFFDKSTWKVLDIKEYLMCIKNINVPKNEVKVIQVKEKLIRLFEYALSKNLPIEIDYF